MKYREIKKFIAVCLMSMLVLYLILSLAGCAGSKTAITEQKKLKVVTSSTDISDIVKDVGGDRVEVDNIIPPAQCPGHFDVKPQSLQVLADASLFLLHDYDQQMKFSEKLVDSVGNKNLNTVLVGQNTMMLPSVRLAGIDRITEAMAKANPQNDAIYRTAAAKLKDETNQVAQEQKKRLDEGAAAQLKVLVAGYQADFAKWAGVEVVGVFPPDISANDTKKLIDLGRQKGATLVIDNLQTPNKAAAVSIAKELGIQQVAVSNFPGGLSGTEKWDNSFKKNVDLILEYVHK